MLALNKRGFMAAHGPVKPVRRVPAMFGRHLPENRDLFGTRLFVGKRLHFHAVTSL